MDDPRYQPHYFTDAWIAMSKRNVSFYTHGPIDLNNLLESVIYVLHEALDFSDVSDPLIPRDIEGMKSQGKIHSHKSSLSLRGGIINPHNKPPLENRKILTAPRKKCEAR